MARWITLILLIILTIFAAWKLSPKIEQQLHSDIVRVLADEDLSEVRAELDGRDVLLSGPEELLPQARNIVARLAGVRRVDSRAFAKVQEKFSKPQNLSPVPEIASFKQIEHPEGPFWPPRGSGSLEIESALQITKIQDSIEVNGSVPDSQIKDDILFKLAQLIDIPDHLFNVTVNKISEKPEWYLQDLPLIIPFMQWVEEGQLQYYDDKITVEGIVTGIKAKRAFDAAIANIPAQFYIENRLKVGAD